MNNPSHNGIITRAVGDSTVGSCLWRRSGTLHLTAIVKASFAIDETGAVQPSRDQLLAQKGTKFNYHYNGIQAWHVASDDEVTNVYS